MCIVLEEETVVLSTRIDPVTAATGEVIAIKVNLDEIIVTFQTIIAVSSCPGQEFLSVFCHEDGSRSSRPPQCGGQTKCGGIVLSGICHLQRGAGTYCIFVFNNVIFTYILRPIQNT